MAVDNLKIKTGKIITLESYYNQLTANTIRKLVMATLDLYGISLTDVEDVCSYLLLRLNDVDEYGFRRAEDFDYTTYENFMSTYLKTLTKRRIRWEALVRKNADFTKLTPTLKRFIRKGIPAPYRPDVWMKISGAYQLQKRSPELYRNLLKIHFDKETGDSVKIDLPRTFPDNIYFDTKKEKLFNVLMAYAHHNREIGYCQGLNYIAGLLIIVTDNEETTFWLLKVIVENIVPLYHTRNMINLIRDLAVLKELIILKVPEVNKHIENLGNSFLKGKFLVCKTEHYLSFSKRNIVYFPKEITGYGCDVFKALSNPLGKNYMCVKLYNHLGLPYAVIASKWFICLYAEVLPVETVLRIWDCVFAEGYKILFRVGLTMILTHKNKILETDDISALANLFRSEMVNDEIVTNCHSFIESIFKVPGNFKRRDLEMLRKKCTGKPSS